MSIPPSSSSSACKRGPLPPTRKGKLSEPGPPGADGHATLHGNLFLAQAAEIGEYLPGHDYAADAPAVTEGGGSDVATARSSASSAS